MLTRPPIFYRSALGNFVPMPADLGHAGDLQTEILAEILPMPLPAD